MAIIIDALKLGSKPIQSRFSRPSKSASNARIIDEEAISRYRPGGYHPVRLGDVFKNGKYRIIGKLGYGVYSTVWLASDMETKRHVALKILTADSFGKGKDTFELAIMRYMKGHVAEAPDITSKNILIETPAINRMFDELPSEAFKPDLLPLAPPNDFYMQSEQVSWAQEDLKVSKDISVRLADFGTSSWTDNHLAEWIQPDLLRAPEVILGAPWNSKVDIWNLGLMIWELTTGSFLFDGIWSPREPYTAEAHLAQMTTILGAIPTSLLSKSERRDQYVDAKGNLLRRSPFGSLSLHTICRNPMSATDRAAFLEFIGAMTRLEPIQRPDAMALLEYDWVKKL
ncbi:Serine/threonine-protein kinase SKY1 [Colletotrichum viniferum]|nr:Serine/threonine-protein kinase SKY1 [Colletotrichum viniferum]